MQINLTQQKGFTLVELVISIAIFAMMTTLVLSKFGTFNQGVLLSNVAYDVALTIRNAQSYGINVKSADRAGSDFSFPYGVHFDTLAPNNSSFKFFADLDSDGEYTSVDDKPVVAGSPMFTTTTNIKRGTVISKICVNTCGPTEYVDKMDITFIRPDPNAIILNKNYFSYAKITLKATDGSTKNIEVRSTGQIQVTN